MAAGIKLKTPRPWGAAVVTPPAPKPRPTPGENRAAKLARQWFDVAPKGGAR